MTLSATGMNLAGGTLSSVGLMTVAATQDIDASAPRCMAAAWTSAANLRNPGGKLTSSGDAIIKLGGELDNTGGTIAAAGGPHRCRQPGQPRRHRGRRQPDRHHQRRHRQPARPAAGRRHADPDGFEPGQQQHADRQQRARQGRAGQGGQHRGRRVNNQGGAISAGQDLGIKTGELDNTAGDIAAQGSARIDADTLDNTRGQIAAGQGLGCWSGAARPGLAGLGRGPGVRVRGFLNQEGNLTAGRDLNLSVVAT